MRIARVWYERYLRHLLHDDRRKVIINLDIAEHQIHAAAFDNANGNWTGAFLVPLIDQNRLYRRHRFNLSRMNKVRKIGKT
jgi:hypothetical protein